MIKDEKGVTAIEYAIIGVIVVAAVVAVGTGFIGTLFDNLNTKASEAGT
jgi:Flp pilus assembly pilin Flp